MIATENTEDFFSVSSVADNINIDLYRLPLGKQNTVSVAVGGITFRQSLPRI